MKPYEGIKQGLEEAIAFAQGDLKAQTILVEIQPVHKWSKEEIQAFRHELALTQKLFAAVMGVSVKTVEAWESGRNQPSGSSLQLMTVLKQNPDSIKSLYRPAA